MSISGSAMPRCMVGLLYLSLRGAAQRRRSNPGQRQRPPDCFVASLLAMTVSNNLLPQPGDRLEIALVLAGEAQHEVRAAGAHVFVEPLGDAGRRSRVAHLPLA